jgi:hypothetical protein
MQKRPFLRGDKRLCAPIAIGSGLTIFFFGVSLFSSCYIVRWIDIIFGIALIIIGVLLLNSIRDTHSPSTGEQSREVTNNRSPTTTTPSDEHDLQEWYEQRSADWQSLKDALLDQSRSFDKYVLTLAAGAFGLSLAFMRQIVPAPLDYTVPYLIVAWSCFTASILATLLSFLFSQKACLREIEIHNQVLRHADPPPNPFSKTTGRLNWTSMGCFMSGIVFLLMFSAINILSR